MTELDKNCLSHWFPLIEAAGLPVPETRIVRTELDLTPMLDGQTVNGEAQFLDKLAEAADAIGYPVFLRTGHCSGKHDWEKTCYVTDPKQLAQHVFNLVEWSHTVDMMGLPTDVWAVREMLPTKPVFTAFRGMPICSEFRLFVDGPEVVCVHPYWPRGALVGGFPLKPRPNTPGEWLNISEDDYLLPEDFEEKYRSLLRLSPNEREEIPALASRAGKALGGMWSVDLLETDRGWYLTDCAKACDSFHWDGCEHASRFDQEEVPA